MKREKPMWEIYNEENEKAKYEYIMYMKEMILYDMKKYDKY